MQLGLVTPIVNLNPRFDPAEWEIDGGIDEIVTIGLKAEALGYDFIGCPEHVAIPSRVAGARGGRYWDPVVTLSYLAALTEQIGLLSHVTVLGYHHPLAIVKRYGTLDVASGGRVILGVGVGSLKSEFRLLGAEFDDRGPLADDALRAIRASFGHLAPSYEGSHYSFSEVIVEPAGIQEHVRIWVGGNSRRSLRRALELGDGWIPFGRTLEELGPLLGDASLAQLREERSEGFDVILAPEPPLDPLSDPAGCARTVEAYRAIGATGLALRFVSASLSHYLEQLEAMCEVMGPRT
jgi:probable F420-dependent oxidoreductase